jgi:hypothetical protein
LGSCVFGVEGFQLQVAVARFDDDEEGELVVGLRPIDLERSASIASLIDN